MVIQKSLGQSFSQLGIIFKALKHNHNFLMYVFVYQLRKKCSWLRFKFNEKGSLNSKALKTLAVFNTYSKSVELETWVVHDLTKYSKIMCFITINMDSPLATASWNRPRSKVSLVLVQMSSSSVLAPKSKSISESWNNYSSRRSCCENFKMLAYPWFELATLGQKLCENVGDPTLHGSIRA